jgi:hypothetical protein
LLLLVQLLTAACLLLLLPWRLCVGLALWLRAA